MIKTSDDLLLFMAEILTREQVEMIFEKARKLDPTDGPSDKFGAARITLASILTKISKANSSDEDWFKIFYEMKYGV